MLKPFESQNEPVLSLQLDRRTDANLWKLNNIKLIKIVFWGEKNHYMDPCCQDRRVERKSQLKTIEVRLFSVSLISFSCSCFTHWQWFLRTSNWWTTHSVTGCEFLNSWVLVGLGCVTPYHLWLVTLPQIRSDWWSLTARGSQLNLELTNVAWWQMWWDEFFFFFLSQRRALMDFSPPPYGVLKPFLMGCRHLHSHLLYSVFFPI